MGQKQSVTSQTNGDISALAKDLKLNGKELETPRMYPVDWKAGQMFTEEEDPDRMKGFSWRVPKFVTEKDPIAQRGRLSVEEVDLESIGVDTKPNARWPYTSFAKVVNNILEPEECEELLLSVNEKGFTPALLNVGSGRQMLEKRCRDGHRCVVDSPELTRYLFEILKPHLPSKVCVQNNQGGMNIVELNERCRFLCYLPGQQFPSHQDGCFIRPPSEDKGGDMSRITVQMYLHDVPEKSGGATTFIGKKKDFACQPKCGSALIFSQNLLHEGSLVKEGIKYTMRTEVMYRPNE